jgi:hypothetical protein
MVVWLVLALARSVLVSPESLKSIEVETLDLDVFLGHVSNHSLVVAVVAKSSETATITCFLHAQVLFPQAKIVFISPSAIKPCWPTTLGLLPRTS